MINEYRFGRVIVDGKTYRSDVIIYPDKVEGNWWRKEGHHLYPEDIRDILVDKPEVLVVGTGDFGLMKVDRKTKELLEAEGVELIAEKTKSAVDTYNRLSPTKRVVAALHLTC